MGNLWVADNWHFRIAEFDSNGNFLQAFGSGYLPGGPGYVATDSARYVYANDTNHSRVAKFTTEGTFVGYVGVGLLNGPYGVAVDLSGNLWLADSFNHRIVEFDRDGNSVKAFGAYGAGNGELNQPTGVAVDASGNVWVADSLNFRIQEFSSDGTFISSVWKSWHGGGAVCLGRRIDRRLIRRGSGSPTPITTASRCSRQLTAGRIVLARW